MTELAERFHACLNVLARTPLLDACIREISSDSNNCTLLLETGAELKDFVAVFFPQRPLILDSIENKIKKRQQIAAVQLQVLKEYQELAKSFDTQELFKIRDDIYPQINRAFSYLVLVHEYVFDLEHTLSEPNETLSDYINIFDEMENRSQRLEDAEKEPGHLITGIGRLWTCIYAINFCQMYLDNQLSVRSFGAFHRKRQMKQEKNILKEIVKNFRECANEFCPPYMTLYKKEFKELSPHSQMYGDLSDIVRDAEKKTRIISETLEIVL